MIGAVAIRQATKDDLSRLKEIINTSFPRFFKNFASHSVSDLSEPTFVYEEEATVVGFAKQIQFKIKQVNYGCLFWIAVEPEHRHQGIALALTNTALEWHKSHGAQVVFASTQRSNKAALATLRKAGFVRMGVGSLRRLFGWRLLQFFGDVWFAPGEVVLAHFLGVS
jgi:ribosomal protein S18 acetylase RimI-like enzyme